MAIWADAVASVPPTVIAVPKTVGNTGLSLNNILSIISAMLGGGTLVGLIVGLARLGVIFQKNKDTNALALKKVGVEDDARLQALLMARVENLEAKVDRNEAECADRIDAAIRANDVRWETRLAEQKLAYEQRIMKLEGDMRQILQQGSSAGHVFALGFNAPEAAARAVKGDGE